MEITIFKIILGAFCTSVFILNVKIIWNFFSKPKNNALDIEKLKEEFVALKIHLESLSNKISLLSEGVDKLSTKLDILSNIVKGNGDPSKSILFRLAQLEKKENS